MKLARPVRTARALLFLSVCFTASAAVRLGEMGAGVVDGGLANLDGAAVAQTAPPEPTAMRPDLQPARDPTLAERAAECDAPPGPLLTAIRERVAALETRETRVAERERLLEVTADRVRAEIARLEDAETKLAATLALADGASERDVAHLVGVYETMKPKNAAGIFDSMEPEFAAGFLARMREDAAAGILAAMNEEAAYAVTVVMAGRHVGAGVAPPQPAAGSPSVDESGR